MTKKEIEESVLEEACETISAAVKAGRHAAYLKEVCALKNMRREFRVYIRTLCKEELCRVVNTAVQAAVVGVLVRSTSYKWKCTCGAEGARDSEFVTHVANCPQASGG